MSSSAVLRVAARDLTRAAEANTYESPASAIAAPGGASKTALSPLHEGGTTYVRRYQERDRSPDRSDFQHVGEEGPRVPGAREGREEEVTAPAIERPNLAAVDLDIAKVLVRHGLADLDTVHIAVHPLMQGGQVAGVTIDAFAYTRPAGLPIEKPTTTDPAAAMAEDLEAVS